VLLGLIVVVGLGVAGYMALEDWTFLESLYMTVMTLTTVGFGEVRTLDTSGVVLTTAIMVAGVGLALTGIALLAQMVADGELGEPGRRRRMQRRIDGLRDHFIVCAYGRVGRAAVRELDLAGVPYVVIDTKEALRERMSDAGFPFLIDDPASESVLRAAGIDQARALLCAVDSDATNVYITLVARSMKPGLLIVARASDPGSAQRLEKAGADRVISPFTSSGRHMAVMALDPSVVDVFEAGSHAHGAIDIEERLVDEVSPLAGRAVGDAGDPVLAVRRADGEVVASPEPDTTLEPGDVVLVLRGA
jgi:voltage-gated potassium channel